MTEIWKDIEGYEGLYQASSFGRIKAIKVRDFFRKKCLNDDGYHTVRLCKNGQCKTLNWHRIIAKVFIKNLENKPEVNHKDGDKLNNRIENLEWCTRKENIQHMFDTGLRNHKGVNNSNTSLTEKDVLFIRENRGVMTQKELCKIFSLKRIAISRIQRGITWSHIYNK